jgi:hypothetical protein
LVTRNNPRNNDREAGEQQRISNQGRQTLFAVLVQSHTTPMNPLLLGKVSSQKAKA